VLTNSATVKSSDQVLPVFVMHSTRATSFILSWDKVQQSLEGTKLVISCKV